MASIYTHFIFGQEVLKKLPSKFRNIIEKHIDYYILGQQGPDFFYFYKPYTNKGSKIGSEIHQSTFENFINRSKKSLKDPSEEQLAYLFGFLCHFALDIMVHPYVNNLEVELQLSHMEIETELDRYYMIQKRRIPYEVETYKLIPNDITISEKISPIFSDYDNGDTSLVKKSIQDFYKYKKLLHSPRRNKEKLIFFTMKRLGLYNKFKGQVLTHMPDKRASISNEVLSKRFNEAIPVAVHLIDNYYNYQIYNGRLSHYFNYNFSGIQLKSI
ncbi:MAG: zinc dependent phospholipase C family protein [Gallicola sp.]|nr:zinc dependent phospholipase C family protein [Gallicola sp.]